LLRAFTYFPRRLLLPLYQKFGQDKVERLLERVIQLMVSTFGVANREAFAQGCRDENIAIPRAWPPDAETAAPFPMGFPTPFPMLDTSVFSFDGVITPLDDDLYVPPSRTEYESNLVARTQLGLSVRSLREKVTDLKTATETAQIKLGESQWKLRAAARQFQASKSDNTGCLDFDTLVNDKDGLVKAIAGLQAQIRSLTIDKMNLADERIDFKIRFETASSLVDGLTAEKLRLQEQYDTLSFAFADYRRNADAVVTGLREEGDALRDRERELIQHLEWTRDEVAELMAVVDTEGGPQWVCPAPFAVSLPTRFPAPIPTGRPALTNGTDIRPVVSSDSVLRYL
jgi:hypothetical protein